MGSGFGKAASTISSSVGQVSQAFGVLNQAATLEGALAALKDVDKEMRALLMSLKEAGSKENVFTALKEDALNLKEYVRTMTADLNKQIGKAIRSVTTKDISKANRDLERSTHGMRRNTQEFAKHLTSANVKIRASVDYAEELVTVLTKQKEKEEAITIQYTARKEAARALLAENKNLIAVAGVAIEKTNEIYVKHKNIQQAVEELKHAEEKINVVYDKLISQQRKAVELMIKQHKSPKIIEAASQRILYLEKQRNRELDKITMEMTKIQKLMVSGATGKEARAMAHNLKLVAIEAHKTAKSVSSLGLSSNLASKNIIRMGGATTGVFRIFSRWRNRILVATFALAGLIRSMQRFVKIAAETQKETAALETVAFNTGTSVKKVTNAVGELAKDGIFSISAITQSLKGLISMGISVDMAVQAIDTFKDSILANGKATLSMDEALTSGIQGLKEFRSQVSDNLGVMKNLDQILKENPDLVKKYGQSTALLIGFMKEAAQFEGARVKVLGMLSGKMMTLTQKIFMTKKALGEMISPIAHELINMVMKYTAAVREFVEENAHIIRAYAKDAGETIVNTVEFIKQLGSAIVTLTKDIGFIVFGTIKWLSKISEVRIAGTSVVKILILMAINFRILTSVLKKFGVVNRWVWFETIGKGVISATKSLFVFNVGLIKTRVSFAFLKTSVIKGMAQIKAAAIALSVALKAAFPALLGIAVVMAAILLVEKYISKLTEVAQKKKEMVALDEERARLAKSIMLDTEILGKVLGAIKNVEGVRKYNIEIEKLGVSIDSLVEKRNEMLKAPIFSMIAKGMFGELIGKDPFAPTKRDISDANKWAATESSQTLSTYQKDLKELTLEKEAFIELYKEEIEYLEKMGIVINEVTGSFQIMSSTGKVLFEASTKEAQIWLDTMLEFEGKMTGMTRLRDKSMKAAAKSEELLAEAISKRQEISQIKTETELIKFYNTYIEKTKDATDAALDYFTQMEDIETQMVDIKNFRDVSMGKLKKEAEQVTELTGDYKRLTKELKEVKEKYILAGTYEDIASQKDIKARKKRIEGIIETIKGLSDEAKAAIKLSDRYDRLSENLEEIKEKYKGLTEVLKAWGEVIDAQVTNVLEKYNEQIIKMGENLDTTGKAIIRQGQAYIDQIAILRDPGNAAALKLKLDIANAEFDALEKITKINDDHVEQKKEINKQLEGARQAVLKMEEGEVAIQAHLDEIVRLEILLSGLEDKRTIAVEATNWALKQQIALMEKQVIVQMKMKWQDISRKGEIKQQTSIWSILGLGTPATMTAEFQKFKEEISYMYENMEKIGITKTEERRDITKTYIDVLDKEKDFWYNYGDIVRQGTEQIITTLANFGKQYLEVSRQFNEQKAADYAKIAQMEEKKLISEAEADRQEAVLDQKYIDMKEIMGLRQKQQAWKMLEDLATAMGTKLLILGITGMLSKSLSHGQQIVAGLALLATGATAIYGLSGASGAGVEAARLEARSGVNLEAMEGGIGTTVTGPQAQTFGSTIQGQPMNVTINPSITIQGELIGIGANGVQELREGLVPLIISAITDAAADGEFDNIVMGVA